MSTKLKNKMEILRTKVNAALAVKFAVLLLSIFCMMPAMKAEAAANPSITVKAVSNLTTTNARINATINNSGKMRLKRCGFVLYNANGKQLKNRYDSINYTMKSFNGWFNLNKYYGKLTPGTTYKYKFYVMNSSNKYFYSGVKSFTTKKDTFLNKITEKVVEAARKVAETVCAKNKKLNYNASAISKIGAQPKGSSYCSVYAISYARAVTGKTPYDKPLNYWVKGAGASWGKGQMKSTKHNTQQAALKAVYDQINAGKPAILYVYGPKSKQHYVTVIGYQNVTNTGKLSMNNFICLDPGYGKEKPLNTYTAPKMTHDSKGNSKGYQVVIF